MNLLFMDSSVLSLDIEISIVEGANTFAKSLNFFNRSASQTNRKMFQKHVIYEGCQYLWNGI